MFHPFLCSAFVQMEFWLGLHLLLSSCLYPGPKLPESQGNRSPPPMSPLLKQLVDTLGFVAFVCDVRIPLAVFSHPERHLEPFQPACVELSIHRGQWLLSWKSKLDTVFSSSVKTLGILTK